MIKILVLSLAIILSLASCKGKNKGCIAKDLGGTGAIGTSAASTQAQFNKGLFGNFIASLLIGQLTKDLYGDSTFWKENNADKGKGMVKKGIIYSAVTGLLKDYNFNLVVFFCIILFITIQGAGLVMGTKSLAVKDLFTDFFRISIVLLFTSVKGWDYYYDFIIRPILFGSKYIAYKFNQSLTASATPDTPFGLIDTALFYAVSPQAMEKIFALFVSGYYGIFYLIAIFFAVVTLLILNLRGMLLYASTMIIAGFLLCCGPIFMVLLIFERTKDFFKTWLTTLVGVAVQQFMIYMVLILMNYIVIAFIRAAMFYEVCWATIAGITIKIPVPSWLASIIGIDYLLKVTIPVVLGFKWLQSLNNPMPDILTNIGCLVVFSLASMKILDVAIEISSALVAGALDPKAGALGGLYTSSAKLNDGLKKVASELAWNNAKSMVSSVTDRLDGTQAQKAVDAKQKKLDAPEEYKKETEKREKEGKEAKEDLDKKLGDKDRGFFTKLGDRLSYGAGAVGRKASGAGSAIANQYNDKIGLNVDIMSNTTITGGDFFGIQKDKNVKEANQKNTEIFKNSVMDGKNADDYKKVQSGQDTDGTGRERLKEAFFENMKANDGLALTKESAGLVDMAWNRSTKGAGFTPDAMKYKVRTRDDSDKIFDAMMKKMENKNVSNFNPDKGNAPDALISNGDASRSEAKGGLKEKPDSNEATKDKAPSDLISNKDSARQSSNNKPEAKNNSKPTKEAGNKVTKDKSENPIENKANLQNGKTEEVKKDKTSDADTTKRTSEPQVINIEVNELPKAQSSAQNSGADTAAKEE
jgi:type IV secretory pathway VirB6-like protein